MDQPVQSPENNMKTSFSDKRLNSWKEIARFLNHDVRTVMRWEKTGGLPVHRMPGGKMPGVSNKEARPCPIFLRFIDYETQRLPCIINVLMTT